MASIAHANVASSSVVERLFSAAGRIVNRDRDRANEMDILL